MMYGDRIRQARELSGMTQTTLAGLVGESQSRIAHFESGRTVPSSEIVEDVAHHTEFLPSFFEQPPFDDFAVRTLSFRSRSSTPAKERTRLKQLTRLLLEQLARMDTEQCGLPPLALTPLQDTPAHAAVFVRALAGLTATEPVRHVTSRIENLGVPILTLPATSRRIDAFSSWPSTVHARPFIATTLGWPGDRLRFSLAHELGHLVMHTSLEYQTRETEQEADQFAGAFLFPEAVAREVLAPSLSLTRAARLKVRWGISMSAIIRRAYELDIISDRRYRYLNEQMGHRGWRTREPSNLDIPAERPRVFRKLVEAHYGHDGQAENLVIQMHVTYRRASEILSGYSSGVHTSTDLLSDTQEYFYAQKHEHRN